MKKLLSVILALMLVLSLAACGGEKKAEIMENMNAIDDAQTGGLAVYTRAADAAEAKIQ